MDRSNGAQSERDRSWLGDERLTGAERKRLVDDLVLQAAANWPADDHSLEARQARAAAFEVRENREYERRRALWAAAEAVGQPPLDAPTAVEQIRAAKRVNEVAVVAARLSGNDLHRAAQVLGIASVALPPDTDEQRIRDMLVGDVGYDLAIWGPSGDRYWDQKIRHNEREMAQHGIDWRAPEAAAADDDVDGM